LEKGGKKINIGESTNFWIFLDFNCWSLQRWTFTTFNIGGKCGQSFMEWWRSNSRLALKDYYAISLARWT